MLVAAYSQFFPQFWLFFFFPSCDVELQIDGFEYLKENFPTSLTEFLEYMARVGEQSVILCRCEYEA